jgi:glycerophosphoryl diester phosphodiesterase
MKKSIWRVIGGAAAALILLALFQYLYPGNPNRLEPQDDFEIVAHRGVHTNWEAGTYDLATGCEATHIYQPTHHFIENTLESIGAAFDYGATIVEIDIQRTSDDQLVILHDYRLECRTDGEGDIGDYPLAYLKTLDIGYGYTYDGGQTYPFRGQGVGMMPTLVEVLEAYPEGRFLIDHKDRTVETVDLLVEIIQGLPPEQRARLYYWGSPEIYDEVIQAGVPEMARLFPSRPEAKRCLLPYMLTFGLGGFGEECSGTAIALPPQYTRFVWGWPYRFVAQAHRVDMEVYLTIDSAEDALAYADLPVDGIVTDYIEVIGPVYGER